MLRTRVLSLSIVLFAAWLSAQPVPGVEREISRPTPSAMSLQFDAMATDGENFLVLWRNRNAYYGTRVTLDGRVIDQYGVPIPVRGQARIVGRDNNGYVIAWADSGVVYVSTLSSDLMLQQRHEIGVLAGQYEGGWSESISEILSSGETFLVVLYNSSHGSFRGRILDATGAPITEWIELGKSPDHNSAFGFDPSGFTLFIVKSGFEADNT